MTCIWNNGLKIIYDPELGHHRLDPYPDQETLAAYYDDDQFYKDHSPSDWFEKELREYHAGLWDSYYEYLIKVTMPPYLKMPLVADVGCGLGTFLNYWAYSDRKGHLIGIEPSDIARDISMSPSFKSLKDWKYHNSELNIISLILVLEHVSNPGDMLHTWVNRLSKGGRLVIVVPNDMSPLQKRLNYTGYISPVHVNYFTPTTLRAVMEMAGLKVIHESATFPMELFPLVGINYFGNDALGRKCHWLRLRWENILGPAVFSLYKKLYDRWGIGRELIFVGEK